MALIKTRQFHPPPWMRALRLCVFLYFVYHSMFGWVRRTARAYIGGYKSTISFDIKLENSCRLWINTHTRLVSLSIDCDWFCPNQFRFSSSTSIDNRQFRLKCVIIIDWPLFDLFCSCSSFRVVGCKSSDRVNQVQVGLIDLNNWYRFIRHLVFAPDLSIIHLSITIFYRYVFFLSHL